MHPNPRSCCLDLTTAVWTHLRVGSSAPAPRCAHVCVTHADSLFVYGGYDGRQYFEDCFEFSLAEAHRLVVVLVVIVVV